MKVTRIHIEWESTTAADETLLPVGEKKTVTFEDGKGWRMHGPIFPRDITLVSMLSEWLKEGWK